MGHQPPFRIVHEQALATLVECRFQPANFGIEKSRPSHTCSLGINEKAGLEKYLLKSEVGKASAFGFP